MKTSFIHIPKTGGTSLTEMFKPDLKKHYRWVDWFESSNNPTGTKQDVNKFLTYTFIRNPWDRVASIYQYKTFLKNTSKENRGSEIGFYAEDEDISFNEWVKLTYLDMKKDHIGIKMGKNIFVTELYTLKDWLCDSEGEIRLDFIGKFENFDKDVEKLSKKINKKINNIVHENKNKMKSNYVKLYNDESVEIIRKYFKYDIEYGEYVFGR